VTDRHLGSTEMTNMLEDVIMGWVFLAAMALFAASQHAA
jgi:hypothetical protein